MNLYRIELYLGLTPIIISDSTSSLSMNHNLSPSVRFIVCLIFCIYQMTLGQVQLGWCQTSRLATLVVNSVTHANQQNAKSVWCDLLMQVQHVK